MDDPLCPISTLELLDRTLSLYSRNFVKFAGLSMAGPMATFAYRLRYGGGTAAFVRLHSSTAAPAVLGVLVGIVIVLAGASWRRLRLSAAAVKCESRKATALSECGSGGLSESYCRCLSVHFQQASFS